MAVLWQLMTLSALPGWAANDSPNGGVKGGIRVGCGLLSDSRGRTVTPNANPGGSPNRPAYCPQTAPVAAAPEQLPEPGAPQAPLDAGLDAASMAPPPATPTAAVQRRPLARIPPRQAMAGNAPIQEPAPAAAAVQALESTRTTHAYGASPPLRLDPMGAGLALVSGGGLLWFLRSAFAASLLLIGLPVWRDLDLLPVMGTANPRPESEDTDEDEAAGRALLTGSNPMALEKS